MKYEMCEKLGLNLEMIDRPYSVKCSYGEQTRSGFKADFFIKASDVEALLKAGLIVSGETLPNDSKHPYQLEVGRNSQATHQGLLIGYKPIEKPKPVTKEEIKSLTGEWTSCDRSRELLKRIEQNGIEG